LKKKRCNFSELTNIPTYSGSTNLLISLCLIQDSETKSHFGVLEYADNGNLHDFLSKHKNLEWTKKIQIAIDVADGLKYLHNTVNMIHRNLRPTAQDAYTKLTQIEINLLEPRNINGEKIVNSEQNMNVNEQNINESCPASPAKSLHSRDTRKNSTLKYLGCYTETSIPVIVEITHTTFLIVDYPDTNMSKIIEYNRFSDPEKIGEGGFGII
ncbi:27608_t:CDS:2, partial [Racocetra persica]